MGRVAREDGTEVFNVIDRCLAVQSYHGKPLPKQVLPFDGNEGAGFWVLAQNESSSISSWRQCSASCSTRSAAISAPVFPLPTTSTSRPR